jgi:glycosyltransferase involved in cell wall biosynthesis
MSVNKFICEIRIPTFRRSKLLRRCLLSVLNQTYPYWRVLIYDDDTDQTNTENLDFVNNLKDDRIRYYRNEFNLKANKNIDRCFASSCNKDVSFIYCLEDDNWLDNEFLKRNILILQKYDSIDVLLRNQVIVNDKCNGEYSLTTQTTRGDIFKGGLIHKTMLRASIFHCEGISNGGLFIRNNNTNLIASKYTNSASMAEYIRSVMINKTIYFDEEPLAYFSRPVSGATLRSSLSNAEFSNGRLSILKNVLKTDASVIEFSINMAKSINREEQFYNDLAELGYSYSGRKGISLYCKAYLRRILFENPVLIDNMIEDNLF